MTIFYGGATDPDILESSDEKLLSAIQSDLQKTMGWDGQQTLFRITRYEHALPAYALGHLERLERIHAAEHKLLPRVITELGEEFEM